MKALARIGHGAPRGVRCAAGFTFGPYFRYHTSQTLARPTHPAGCLVSGYARHCGTGRFPDHPEHCRCSAGGFRAPRTPRIGRTMPMLWLHLVRLWLHLATG